MNWLMSIFRPPEEGTVSDTLPRRVMLPPRKRSPREQNVFLTAERDRIKDELQTARDRCAALEKGNTALADEVTFFRQQLTQLGAQLQEAEKWHADALKQLDEADKTISALRGEANLARQSEEVALLDRDFYKKSCPTAYDRACRVIESECEPNCTEGNCSWKRVSAAVREEAARHAGELLEPTHAPAE